MIKEVIKSAKEAGEILCKGFYSIKDITHKDTKDLVTQYDVAVEEFLKQSLSTKFPEFEIIAEESQAHSKKLFNTFVIDPIDGTTNFVHKVPFCAISIGIYKDGKPFGGVVYNPILNECYEAEIGKGAFMNKQKISVSMQDNFKRSLIATGFPYSNDKSTEDLDWVMKSMRSVLPMCQDIRRLGSASLDLCMVASGVFEGYYEMNLRPWDVSAGIIILEEAGGKTSNCSGEIYDIFEDKVLVATNSKIHNKLQELIN